jgi:DNA-binding NarL/FixJ family response regulator
MVLAAQVRGFGPHVKVDGDCLGESAIRVLVADDSELFRQFICRSLHNRSDLRVIYESYDGQDAVEQARRLQPDLIVLDIGLPALNGFQAALQIRRLSPKSKILFLSQESSPDIVREALDLGAKGFVVKSDAGTELLTAVDTVLRCARFVGSRFAGQDFTSARETGSI